MVSDSQIASGVFIPNSQFLGPPDPAETHLGTQEASHSRLCDCPLLGGEGQLPSHSSPVPASPRLLPTGPTSKACTCPGKRLLPSRVSSPARSMATTVRCWYFLHSSTTSGDQSVGERPSQQQHLRSGSVRKCCVPPVPPQPHPRAAQDRGSSVLKS